MFDSPLASINVGRRERTSAKAVILEAVVVVVVVAVFSRCDEQFANFFTARLGGSPAAHPL